MITKNPNDYCACGSGLPYAECCELLHLGSAQAQNAEQLMRSRYSAYAKQQYAYILNTYTSEQRASLSVEQLQDSDAGVQWLSLKVLSHTSEKDRSTVEFCAYYRVDGQFFMLQEHSYFIRENELWRYASGDIHSNSGQLKLGRNDICLCGSGKKYKKCCA